MAFPSPIHLKNVSDAVRELVLNACDDLVTAVIWEDQPELRPDRPYVSIRRIAGPVSDGIRTDSKSYRDAPTEITLTLDEVEEGRDYSITVNGAVFKSVLAEPGALPPDIIDILLALAQNYQAGFGFEVDSPAPNKIRFAEVYPGSLYSLSVTPAESWTVENGDSVYVQDTLSSRRFLYSIHVWDKHGDQHAGSFEIATRIEASLQSDAAAEICRVRKVPILSVSGVRNLTGRAPDGQVEKRDQLDIEVASSLLYTNTATPIETVVDPVFQTE